MIRSNLAQVKLAKERELGHKITYDMMRQGAGISGGAIARLMSLAPIDRIDGSTLSGLCRYFGCRVGDLMEYVPDA
ncbi:MAG: helix-turn-helix domain-containing protein [Capsulimonadaceae bacterium]